MQYQRVQAAFELLRILAAGGIALALQPNQARKRLDSRIFVQFFQVAQLLMNTAGFQ
jgi:hypothetical protein